MPAKTSLEIIKHAIQTEVFVTAKEEKMTDDWIFDFLRLSLKPKLLRAVAALFWESHKDDGPLQIGGLESAAIPLVTGLVLEAEKYTEEDVSAFFIRKSREKSGLQRMVEGSVSKDQSVILVDDLINSGKSFIRQVELLENQGIRVSAVWSILRFRDLDFYQYFHEKGISVESLFCLYDFVDSLGMKNLKDKEAVECKMPYELKWRFQSPNPSHSFVVSKSQPVLADGLLYFGSDDRAFWALDQRDGSVVWSYEVGMNAKGKAIFSSPAVCGELVIFGGYDGNIYALDKKTGSSRWLNFDADWIGSSPAVAEELGLVFVGLEFGLFKKHGGIAALGTETGVKVWQYDDMPCFTHSTPLYIPKYQQVVIGSNDGAAYLFAAKTGELVWKYETAPADAEFRSLDTGFSGFDIKGSFAYDEKRDQLIFGNATGELAVLKRATGEKAFAFKAEAGIHSTPLVYQDRVIFSSLDKNVYCLDLDTGNEHWRWFAGARVFSSPVIIEDSLYVGANTGRLTELDPNNGQELSFVTVPERITNSVVYNPETECFFLPTFANEIYCLLRTDAPPKDE